MPYQTSLHTHLPILLGFFMINAFNLCDGIDGLGAGMAFIIMVFLCVFILGNR